jgi:hypothetical protein
MSSPHYERLSQRDDDDLDGETHGLQSLHYSNGSDNGNGSDHDRPRRLASFGNESPAVLSRVPSSPRDWSFGLLFALSAAAVVLFSFWEQSSLSHSTANFEHAGSWASIIMIVTLLGSFLGASVAVAALLQVGIESGSSSHATSSSSSPSSTSSSTAAVEALRVTLAFSLVVKVLLGNALLLRHSSSSSFSLVAALLLLLSAARDASRVLPATQALGFTAALLDLTRRVLVAFGMPLSLFVAALVFLQTCGLLWWGAFFAGLVNTVRPAAIVPVSLLMLLLLQWFHELCMAMLHFVVGGCALWLFVRHDDDKNNDSDYEAHTHSDGVAAPSLLTTSTAGPLGHHQHNANSNNTLSTSHSHESRHPPALQRPPSAAQREVLSGQLWLYVQCALSSSFGSLCKAALLLPPATALAQLRHSLLSRYPSHCHHCNCCCFCCGSSGSGSGTVQGTWCPWQQWQWWQWCEQQSRLSLPLLAVYGRTLARTTDDLHTAHPECLVVSREDFTRFAVQSVTTSVAAMVSVLFALTADRKEGSTWPLFLIVCYLVCSCGFSLATGLFASCVDAFVVAAAVRPERLARENPLVLLRFMRTAEVEMQQI